MKCVCNSVAYKLVTCVQSRANCAKHTAALSKPETLLWYLFLQETADASRCVVSAAHHALQHEVCLQLSSLQASHWADCAKHTAALSKPETLLLCLFLQQSADASRCVVSAVHHALQHEDCLRLSCTIAEQLSRFSESCYNQARRSCCFVTGLLLVPGIICKVMFKGVAMFNGLSSTACALAFGHTIFLYDHHEAGRMLRL